MNEAKSLWKKAKDTRRYLTIKKGKQQKSKSGDAAPDIDGTVSEEDGDANELRDELFFLDESNSSNFRETFSLGGLSSIDQNEESCCETPASSYSYMDKKKKRDDNGMEAAAVVSQSIAAFIEQSQEAKNNEPTAKLKHIETWNQLEKMFEKLNDDQIMDLNYAFISQTYEAIVKSRESNK